MPGELAAAGAKRAAGSITTDNMNAGLPSAGVPRRWAWFGGIVLVAIVVSLIVQF